MKKIDISKLKGLVKGLGVLRPYASLLWPGAIISASVVVLAAALLMGNSLKQKVSRQSMPMAAQVKSLLGSTPALRQAEEEKRYQDAYERDANLISRLAMQTTQRELLDYNIFPVPQDTSAMLFTRFGNLFCQQVEKLTARINGRDCPSEEELQTSVQKVSRTARTFSGDLRINSDSAEATVVDELCQARAKAASVYVGAEDISGYNFWREYQYSNLEDGVKDCWFWQLGYWIIEDVFSTVASLNGGSSSVYNSPVKRIVGVGFVTPDKLFGTGQSKKISQDRPKYVVKPEDGLTESLTGRLSNDKTDVVHFSVIVVVNANAVMSFMQELCGEKEHLFTGYIGGDSAQSFKHNQISILESSITTVSPDSMEHQYYRYGQGAVAEVELVCEYIFNKKGYEPVYPEALKKTATSNNAGIQ